MKIVTFILLAVVCCAQTEAGFSNTGKMQSTNLNVSVGGTLDNNGELIGTQSANLSCDTLSGNGLIRAPQISIKTKIFAFTGTIDCSGECTITSTAPFEKKLFKRKGGGKFVIVVNDNAPKQLRSFDYEIEDSLQLITE